MEGLKQNTAIVFPVLIETLMYGRSDSLAGKNMANAYFAPEYVPAIGVVKKNGNEGKPKAAELTYRKYGGALTVESDFVLTDYGDGEYGVGANAAWLDTLNLVTLKIRPARYSFAATAAGASDKTTIVCNQLSTVWANDDDMIDWWIRATSVSNFNEWRKVSDYIAASGTVTLEKALIAQFQNTETFEVVNLRAFRTVGLLEAIRKGTMDDLVEIGELTVPPGVNDSPGKKLAWLWQYLVGKRQMTPALEKLFKSDGVTIIGQAAIADDGQTVTKDRMT